jgi:hypothetical protein
MEAADGKKYLTDTVDPKNLLRLQERYYLRNVMAGNEKDAGRNRISGQTYYNGRNLLPVLTQGKPLRCMAEK